TRSLELLQLRSSRSPEAVIERPYSSNFQSGSSGCLRSQSGRLLRISGTATKLYSAGGEVVAHSRVQASHGSLPAAAPFRSDQMTFQTKHAIAAAWKITPVDAIRLTDSQPLPAGYV